MSGRMLFLGTLGVIALHVPAAMVVTMGALVFAWLAAYAHLAARMSRRLARPRSSALLNGAVGTVLVALGARLGLGHA